MAEWSALKAWVYSKRQAWGLKYYCATLETCKSQKWHAHIMLQFRTEGCRYARDYAFDGAAAGRRNPTVTLLGKGAEASGA